MFELSFAADWDEFFLRMDKPIQQILWKKTLKLEFPIKARHLKHNVPIFVAEAGQYRICFREKQKMREILFAGNHKQYHKWVFSEKWKRYETWTK